MAEENNLCFSDRKIHLILFRAKKYMDDKEEMFAYLDRQMGEDRFHCNLIKIIYVLGIPQKISQSDDTYATAKECADMVTKNYKLASKYVAWGINAWCDALGMSVYLSVPEETIAEEHEIRKDEPEIVPDWEGDIDKETHMNITGNVYGDIEALMVGDINGDVEGNINKTLKGNVGGDIVGDISGELYGNIGGDIIGNVYGTIYGDVLGDILGDIHGKINGNVEGSIDGDIYGVIGGDVFGDVFGIIQGKVEGTVFGDIETEDGNVTDIYEIHDQPTKEEIDTLIVAIDKIESTVPEDKPVSTPNPQTISQPKPQQKSKSAPQPRYGGYSHSRVNYWGSGMSGGVNYDCSNDYNP